MSSWRRWVGVVVFGCPEVTEVISDRPFRPGVVESLAYETLVHVGGDRVEAFWVARGRVVHYRAPVESRVSVRNSVCMHKFHPLNEENL